MLSAIMICSVLLLCIQYCVHVVIAIIAALHAQGFKTMNKTFGVKKPSFY